MIAVIGASGNTGSKITTQLLKNGAQVRAIGRTGSRLTGLAHAGAQPIVGDIGDPKFLAEAFRGADAVYSLIPADPTWENYHQMADRLGEAIVGSIRASGVRHVVSLSSVGAHLSAGTGFITSLYRQEQRLRSIDGVNLLFLRPGLFFEGFVISLDAIKHHGVHADTVAADVQIPMIATQDIAEVAARALLNRDWTGVTVRELLGARDLSYAEATKILGARLGLPELAYVQVPEADMTTALIGAGMSENFASLVMETNRALSAGILKPEGVRRPENTTSTRFEDFAQLLAAPYNGKAA